MDDGFGAAAAAWPVVVIAGLGAFHGLNPGMGWLFAVALGMQERRRAALWRAVAALALGHALAILAAIAVGVLASAVASDAAIRTIVAASLVLLGASRLVRARHPRAGGMRVGFAGLTGWSLLMATAHGAGLMVLPFVLQAPVHAAGPHAAHAAQAAGGSWTWSLTATAVHGLAYLLVTAGLAWVVYEKVGVGLLRRAWLNVDVIWAAALIVTGVTALIVL